MRPRDRAKHKGRRPVGSFFRLPTEVLNSPAFLSLTFKGRALLLDLGARFNGHNNGDLAMPWSWMRPRGWKSKETLRRAMLELIEVGMIELTRQGGLHAPSLFAFTWIEIHDCGGKLDVPSTAVPSGKWRRFQPAGKAA